jgi:hypothetical protein
MVFIGKFAPEVIPGESRPFPMVFLPSLPAGDTISTAASVLDTVVGTDAGAAALIVGSPAINVAPYPLPNGQTAPIGTVVTQQIGGTVASGHAFIAGVTYRWTCSVVTAGGSTFINDAWIVCVAPT